MSLKIEIDAASIASQFKELAYEVEQDLRKGVAGLAAMTHAKVAEMASNELHSSKKTFDKALGFEQIADGIWVVSIDESALFIEDGLPAGMDMKPGLLKNGKMSANGTKYKVIPFEHSKGPSQMNGYAQNLVAQIKRGLKKEGVPFKSIEKNANGSPKLGKLHTFNFEAGKASSKWSTDPLKGVSIYQTMTRTGNVRRDIMTFRTVTSGPASEGKWIHPGIEPKNYLSRAEEWAIKEWENNILPQILDKYK